MRNIKDSFLFCIAMTALIYLVCSIFTILAGICEYSNSHLDHGLKIYCFRTKYNRAMTYTGLKYPYKLGCWLGEDVD